MNRHGFTLFEILLVMGVFGILSSITVFSGTGILKKAAQTEWRETIPIIKTASQRKLLEDNGWIPDARGNKALMLAFPGFEIPENSNYNYWIDPDFCGGGATRIGAQGITALTKGEIYCHLWSGGFAYGEGCLPKDIYGTGWKEGD